MKYKTPELEELLQEVILQNKKCKKQLLKLEPFASQIDLTKYTMTEEIFREDINLMTGKTIKITWNIDKVIDFSKQHYLDEGRIHSYNPVDIYESSDFCFNSEEAKVTINCVKESMEKGNTFQHKTPYIIMAGVPHTNGYCIIDGNHRFFEALLKKAPSIDCFQMAGNECIPFLQEESQKYIEFCDKMENVILQKSNKHLLRRLFLR